MLRHNTDGRHTIPVFRGNLDSPGRPLGQERRSRCGNRPPGTPTNRRTAVENLHSIRSSAHNIELESNRLVYDRMKNRFQRTARSAVSSAARASLMTAVPVVGDTRAFRVFQPSTAVGASGTCADFVEITARAVYVGTKSVITKTCRSSRGTDGFPLHSGRAGIRTEMYPTINTNFADPLVTDQFTDADQHVNMVFTPAIPAGIGGFVISCDFFVRTRRTIRPAILARIFTLEFQRCGNRVSSDNPTSGSVLCGR